MKWTSLTAGNHAKKVTTKWVVLVALTKTLLHLFQSPSQAKTNLSHKEAKAAIWKKMKLRCLTVTLIFKKQRSSLKTSN